MPTPSKPLQLVKKHFTKEEKKLRADAEKALITGVPMREWPETKASKIAHAQYLRLSRLYASIGKNDGMLEAVINRYCAMLAESKTLEEDERKIRAGMEELDTRKSEMEYADYIAAYTISMKLIDRIQTRQVTCRKMLLDVERENAMTLASQLRSIPKKVTEPDKASTMSQYTRMHGS